MDNILYYATLDKDNRVVNIAEESTGKIRCSPNFIPIASMDTTLIGKYYYNNQFITEAQRNLELMKTVDGSGSGLDADMLDGSEGSTVVKIDSTGKYATAPTPENTTDSSTKVATTNWVSNCETIPHLTTNNEYVGQNTFNGIVYSKYPVRTGYKYVGSVRTNLTSTYKFRKYVNIQAVSTVCVYSFEIKIGKGKAPVRYTIESTSGSMNIFATSDILNEYVLFAKKANGSVDVYINEYLSGVTSARGYIQNYASVNAMYTEEFTSSTDSYAIDGTTVTKNDETTETVTFLTPTQY